MTQQWNSHYIDSNDIRLHVTRAGVGNGRILICLHGITDNGLCWTRFAREMEDKFELVMVDARGHGRSDAPPSGYAPADHAADLKGLIDALNIERPILVGHSMGAMTIAQFLVDYPGVAQCAVLEDPPWVLPEVAPFIVEGVAGWRAQLTIDQQRPVEAFLVEGRAQNPTWHEDEFLPWAESKKQVSLHAFDIISEESWRAWPTQVPRFQEPVLLLTADPSRGAIIQPDIAQQAATLSPNLHHVHIANAGHSIRRENLVGVVTAVIDFLSKGIK